VRGTPKDNEYPSRMPENNQELSHQDTNLGPVNPDEWELEEAFDVVKFAWELINGSPYKETKDEHGHSYTAAARVPMNIMRRITRLKEAKGMHYEINSDVIRDALYVGLPILERRWRYSETAQTRRRIGETMAAVQDAEEIAEDVASFSRSLEALINLDEMRTAVRKLTSVVVAAIGEPDNWDKIMYVKHLSKSPVCKSVLKNCSKYIRDEVEILSKRQAMEE